jgi:DNA mismatch repair protein MutL
LGRIRVLSDAVANKIAAGEVVERPSSVVKELLENSLDAGACTLRIDVEGGGRRLIRVADDGCGMLRDDALLAFERHATSKLSDVKDLLSISTLGFRGEALPSIASVSRLTLETRSADEQTGSRIEIAGGKMLRCEEAAIARGTVVTVRDLFYNVPARKKFLRSEQTEMAHIASLATHYSLAYPEKAFELTHNHAEVLYATPVETLRERVFQVFGSQILEELVEIHGAERHIPAENGEEGSFFRVRGFVSQPQFQKLNRNSIYLFVNGRLIRDRTLLHALSSAYQNLMPANVFPFALVFLECSPEEVDVNVHPSKTEVRFRRAGFVHDFVRDCIREALTASRPVSNLPSGRISAVAAAPQPAAALPYSEFSQQLENPDFRRPHSEAPLAPLAASEILQTHQPFGSQLPEFTLRPQPAPQRLAFGSPAPAGAGAAAASPPASARIRRVPDTHGPFPEGLYAEPSPGLDTLSDLRPLGQLHDSFIVAAGRDGLWIIDQHVAHERILFEQILRQMAAGRIERQQLLMPILIELSVSQRLELNRIAEDLHGAGFEIDAFGPRTIAIKAAPAALCAGEVEKVVFEILEIAEGELRQASLEDFRREMAASIACRAAIKVNTPLDAHKIQWLLDTLAACEFPMSCPHGRPIALRYATREILRSFHRI